jgi:hypothetical protein
MRLLGRRAECEALDQFLPHAAGWSGRVAVLRGEAGGQEHAAGLPGRAGSGMEVATAVGVESEMELDYGGLHQLSPP